jgi:lysophospholipase L1-like esterase
MLRYLALGDSYTIGEQVPQAESFPFQTAGLLRKEYGLPIEDPRIIATTGWTSGELKTALKEAAPENDFDFVSLLIGVNNQYRGLDPELYEKDFAQLLLKAILLAKSKAGHVFVLSVPDWGHTPFAAKEGKNKEDIAAAIDTMNKVNKSITIAYRCHYLDITPGSREHGSMEDYLAQDQLHYSGKEYADWAAQLATVMAKARG